jgi:hypothetical protein
MASFPSLFSVRFTFLFLVILAASKFPVHVNSLIYVLYCIISNIWFFNCSVVEGSFFTPLLSSFRVISGHMTELYPVALLISSS